MLGFCLVGNISRVVRQRTCCDYTEPQRFESFVVHHEFLQKNHPAS